MKTEKVAKARGESTLVKRWTEHQQAIQQLREQKAEWQAEITRLSESGTGSEAELDRLLLLQNKLETWPKRVEAVRQRGRAIETELRAAVDEKQAKIQPLASAAAQRLLADTVEKLREVCCGDDELAESLALQTPRVTHAFDRCRITPSSNAVEMIAEIKHLSAVEAELEAEARGEVIPVPEPSLKRLLRECNEATVKQGVAEAKQYEKHLEKMLGIGARNDADYDIRVERTRRQMARI